jgi:hypothetical protein
MQPTTQSPFVRFLQCFSNIKNEYGLVGTTPKKKSKPKAGRVVVLPSNQDEPDLEQDDTFDPLYHNGAAMLDWLEGDLLENTEDRDSPFWSPRSNCCKIAYEYLQFIRNDVGIDLRILEQRWRQLPVVLRPPHVSSRDLTDLQLTLMSNLKNARLAFVCRATRAAIALCRASLELVLAQFYIPKHEDATDNSGQGPGLKKLISLAACNHRSIKAVEKELFELKASADAILHRVQSPTFDKQDELTVRFLEILSKLINDAPPPT